MRIMITIYDGAIAKNILRTDAFRVLRETPGVDIDVLVNGRKLDYYRTAFPFQRVRFSASPSETNYLDRLLSIVVLNSIPTRAMRIWQRSRYLSKGKFFVYAIASFLRTLGRFRIWRRIIRIVDAFMPTPRVYSEMLDRDKPDVLFLTTMMSPDDVALARLAKRRKIPAVGMIKGWDNPTTKTFIRQIPDKVVVHNEIIKGEIERLYDVSAERVAVTGIPQYDHWFDPEMVIPKEKFFRSLGFDTERKLILYAAAGDWMNKADEEIVRMLSAASLDDRLPRMQILVRLHPKYPSTAESLKGLPNVVVERPGTSSTGELVHWEYEEGDIKRLVSSLKWSDVVINTASTFTIDAVIFDKPVVLIGFDGSRKLPHDSSVVRYYDREHMRQIIESGGARLAKSSEEMIATLVDYLRDPTLDAAGRARIRNEQCSLLDGKAGERIAKIVLDTFAQRALENL